MEKEEKQVYKERIQFFGETMKLCKIALVLFLVPISIQVYGQLSYCGNYVVDFDETKKTLQVRDARLDSGVPVLYLAHCREYYYDQKTNLLSVMIRTAITGRPKSAFSYTMKLYNMSDTIREIFSFASSMYMYGEISLDKMVLLVIVGENILLYIYNSEKKTYEKRCVFVIDKPVVRYSMGCHSPAYNMKILHYCLSPDGSYCSIKNKNSVFVYKINKDGYGLDVLKSVLHRTGNIACCCFRDSSLFSVEINGDEQLYDMVRGECIHQVKRPAYSFNYKLSPDGKHLAIGERLTGVGLYERVFVKLVGLSAKKVGLSQKSVSFDFNQDGLLCIKSPRYIREYNVETKVMKMFPNLQQSVWSDDEKYLCGMKNDQYVLYTLKKQKLNERVVALKPVETVILFKCKVSNRYAVTFKDNNTKLEIKRYGGHDLVYSIPEKRRLCMFDTDVVDRCEYDKKNEQVTLFNNDGELGTINVKNAVLLGLALSKQKKARIDYKIGRKRKRDSFWSFDEATKETEKPTKKRKLKI